MPTRSTDDDSPGGLRHVPALDGLRGLAILLILGDHLLWSNYHTGSRLFDTLIAVRRSLWIGVNLFFALSGFLITNILWNTLHQPHFFRNFFARRALRILPLYYGVLFTLLALTRLLHFQWNGWQWLYLTYTANLVLSSAAGPTLPHININHFWSLQVEEQFYILWPLVVYRLRNLSSLLRFAAAGCLCVLLIRTGLVFFHAQALDRYITMSPTFSCVDNLLYGCILAVLLRSTYRDRTLSLAPRVFFLCAVALLLMAIPDHGLRYYNSVAQQTLGASLLGLGSAALVAMALVPASRTARLFDLRLLRFFGKYSYGLYVFHYTLDLNLTAPCRAFLLTYTHSKALAVVGAALLVTAASVVVAVLSYHLYERHFLKLKRFFPYRAAITLPETRT